MLKNIIQLFQMRSHHLAVISRIARIPGTKESLGSLPGPKATLGGHHGNLSPHVERQLATPLAREVGQSLKGNSLVSSKTLNPGQKEHESVLMQYGDGLG